MLVDGYERLLEVVPHGAATSLWVSALEPEHDAERGGASRQFKEGAFIELPALVQYVLTVETRSPESNLGLLQPIPGSPHTVVVGRVVKCINSHQFVCAVGQQDALLAVELECSQPVPVGQVVTFTGELVHVG